MQKILKQILQQKWQILFWAFLSLVTFLLLIELAPKPQKIPHLDKIQHAVIFTILTLSAATAWKPHIYWLVAALILYGASTELFQGLFTVTRQASIYDWLADCVGIAIGLLIFALYQKILLNKR
jgi:VanZ family protein